MLQSSLPCPLACDALHSRRSLLPFEGMQRRFRVEE